MPALTRAGMAPKLWSVILDKDGSVVDQWQVVAINGDEALKKAFAAATKVGHDYRDGHHLWHTSLMPGNVLL